MSEAASPAMSPSTKAAGASPSRSKGEGAAPEWKAPASAPATNNSLLTSLSLPDLKVVERRNDAYAEAWRQRVDHHASAQSYAARLAARRKHEAEVLQEIRGMRDTLTSSGRTGVLADLTPVPHSIKSMHADCMRREELARRSLIASRETILAADRMETLGHLKKEANFRVRSNKDQHAEAMKHKRALERKRLEVDRAAELALRAKEKAKKEARKQQQAAELEQTVADRRASKDQATKREEAKAYQKKKQRDAAAEAKAAALRAHRAAVERWKTAELAKKLETAWHHAESLVVRIEDSFNAHVLKFNLQNHPLVKARKFDLSLSMASLTVDDTSEQSGSRPGSPTGGRVASSNALGMMSAMSTSSVFPTDYAESELEQLHHKMILARKREGAARQTFERTRYDSMTPEERMLAAERD